MASPSEDMSQQLLRCRLWTISTISSRVKLASSYVDSNGCDRPGAGIFCMSLPPFLFRICVACDDGQRMGPLQMKTFPSSFGIRLIQSLVRRLLLAGREQVWRGRRRGAEVGRIHQTWVSTIHIRFLQLSSFHCLRFEKAFFFRKVPNNKGLPHYAGQASGASKKDSA